MYGSSRKNHLVFLNQYGIPEGPKRDRNIQGVYGPQSKVSGERFWARGYGVLTVGIDEEVVRVYIRCQDKEEE